MIYVTKLNGGEMVINADLIETVEKTPDTIISLTTGKKYMVKETVEEVVSRAIAYRQKAFLPDIRLAGAREKEPDQEVNP